MTLCRLVCDATVTFDPRKRFSKKRSLKKTLRSTLSRLLGQVGLSGQTGRIGNLIGAKSPAGSDEEFEEAVNTYIEMYMEKQGVVDPETDMKIRSFLQHLELRRQYGELSDDVVHTILSEIAERGFEVALREARQHEDM